MLFVLLSVESEVDKKKIRLTRYSTRKKTTKLDELNHMNFILSLGSLTYKVLNTDAIAMIVLSSYQYNCVYLLLPHSEFNVLNRQ